MKRQRDERPDAANGLNELPRELFSLIAWHCVPDTARTSARWLHYWAHHTLARLCRHQQACFAQQCDTDEALRALFAALQSALPPEGGDEVDIVYRRVGLRRLFAIGRQSERHAVLLWTSLDAELQASLCADVARLPETCFRRRLRAGEASRVLAVHSSEIVLHRYDIRRELRAVHRQPVPLLVELLASALVLAEYRDEGRVIISDDMRFARYRHVYVYDAAATDNACDPRTCDWAVPIEFSAPDGVLSFRREASHYVDVRRLHRLGKDTRDGPQGALYTALNMSDDDDHATLRARIMASRRFLDALRVYRPPKRGKG
jgi:hypothetical protein